MSLCVNVRSVEPLYSRVRGTPGKVSKLTGILISGVDWYYIGHVLGQFRASVLNTGVSTFQGVRLEGFPLGVGLEGFPCTDSL